jgi:hypothetical protein
LAQELDIFAQVSGLRHQVTINKIGEFVACSVEPLRSTQPRPISVNVSLQSGEPQTEERLADILKHQSSQWVYVQRGLRIVTRSMIHVFKMPRRIDWTRSQALNDADDIIGEVLLS